MPEMFPQWSHPDFETRAFPYLPTEFIFEAGDLMCSTSVWSFQGKYMLLLPCNEILTDQNCHRVLLVMTCSDIQTQTTSTLPDTFSDQTVNQYFWLETDYSFLPDHAICSFCRRWNPDWPVVAKGYWYRQFSTFQHIVFVNESFQFLKQGLKRRICSFS